VKSEETAADLHGQKINILGHVSTAGGLVLPPRGSIQYYSFWKSVLLQA